VTVGAIGGIGRAAVRIVGAVRRGLGRGAGERARASSAVRASSLRSQSISSASWAVAICSASSAEGDPGTLRPGSGGRNRFT
jgi:hypothetical protein